MIVLKLLFDTFGAKAIRLALIAFGACIALVGLVWRHDANVRNDVVRDINSKGQKVANEAHNTRTSAERSATLERLRRTNCRDC